MPKLSSVPKMFALHLHEDGTPSIAVVAASEAEAWHHLRRNLGAMKPVSPAMAFELGSLGVPRVYAKPEYRNDGIQDELPFGGLEVSHAQP